MNWYGNVSPRQRRTYNILISIIALTVPCYCLGLIALALAPSTRAGGSQPTPALSPPGNPLVAAITSPPDATQQITPTEWQPHTVTPTQTSSPTRTGTPTASPAPTLAPAATATVSQPTDIPTPLPSPTPELTNTVAPTATTVAPTATPQQEVYTLRLAKRDGDSLFVVNESKRAFPLEPLRLGDGDGAIHGSEWNVEALDPGECVTAWKTGGKPRAPSIPCEQVGRRLARSGDHRFWQSAFNIYYQGETVGKCAEAQCTITIAVR